MRDSGRFIAASLGKSPSDASPYVRSPGVFAQHVAMVKGRREPETGVAKIAHQRHRVAFFYARQYDDSAA